MNAGGVPHGNRSYLPAEEALSFQGLRLPQEDVYQERPQGFGPPPRKGPRTSLPLIEEGRGLGGLGGVLPLFHGFIRKVNMASYNPLGRFGHRRLAGLYSL